MEQKAGFKFLSTFSFRGISNHRARGRAKRWVVGIWLGLLVPGPTSVVNAQILESGWLQASLSPQGQTRLSTLIGSRAEGGLADSPGLGVKGLPARSSLFRSIFRGGWHFETAYQDTAAGPDADWVVGEGLQMTSTSPSQLGDSQGFYRRVGRDLRDLVAVPKRLSSRGWRRLGFGLLAIGAVHLADDKIRDWAVTEDEVSQRLAESIRPLGQQEGIALLGLTWLGSRGMGYNGLTALSEDALEATLVSAGLISGSLKALTGRSRPGGGSDSFPSGDVTQTFAIASVVAAHSEKKWIGVLSYTVAGLVAWERVRLDYHWASDVVAGALLGSVTGRWVVRRNRGGWQAEHRFTFTPLVGNQAYGLGVRLAF